MRTLRAAIRIVLFVTATLGVYSVWFVLRVFIPNKVYWRQVIFHAWARSFKFVSHMRIEVRGTLPKPPFFLVSNHLSYIDIAALRCVIPTVFVAKAEVESWFLAGRICRDMGTIFIDRSNRRDIPRAGEKITERINAGEGVVVFPEGMSTRGDDVKPFNSSFFEFAAQSKIPVSYAAIMYKTPTGELPPHLAASWWEEISFFAHMWRLFHLPHFTANIEFGDEAVSSTDRKELAKQLHEKVSDKFIPIYPPQLN